MIRALIVGFVALVLSTGTIWASDLTDSVSSACEGLTVECPIEESRGGFPIEFTSEEIDFSNQETISSSFNIGAFILNWLVWVGVVSLLYFIAAGIFKAFGKAAVIAYIVASALGYSISVGTWF